MSALGGSVMNHNYLLFIILLVFSSQNFSAYAFDNKKTHRQLTEAAIKPSVSNLKSYLINNLGFSEGYEKILKGIDHNGYEQNYPVVTWLQEGSTDEDLPTFCRASNHFHNPIHSGDWLQSQMSDSLTVDVSCGTSHRYSNVTWATGFRNSLDYIGTRTGQDRNLRGLYDAPQEMGWDSARVYFYSALTLNDPATREAKFIRTFRAVGQVMHLLQDMAVPAHVRNDMQSHLWNNWNPSNWGNPFEKYVVSHTDAISITPIKPTFSGNKRLTNFWDTNSYTGENPNDSIGQGIGLAEYTNANFVSDFTIFKPQSDIKHYFKYPSQTTSGRIYWNS